MVVQCTLRTMNAIRNAWSIPMQDCAQKRKFCAILFNNLKIKIKCPICSTKGCAVYIKNNECHQKCLVYSNGRLCPEKEESMHFSLRIWKLQYIWLWNMVRYIKGRMHTKVIWKQDPRANNWTQVGRKWGVEKAPHWVTSEFVPFT